MNNLTPHVEFHPDVSSGDPWHSEMTTFQVPTGLSIPCTSESSNLHSIMSRFYELSADNVDDFDFALEEDTCDVARSSSAPSKSSHPSGTTKNWKTIYPRYLDCKASYQPGGRRVNLDHSLRWPLAHQILYACQQFDLPCELEKDKVHPADWQNPGRVKVLIKRNGKPINASIPSKHTLLCKIGSLLRQLETVRLKRPPPSSGNRKLAPLPDISLRLPYNSPAISHGFLAMTEAESQKPTDPSNSSLNETQTKDEAPMSSIEAKKAPASKNKKKKGKK